MVHIGIFDESDYSRTKMIDVAERMGHQASGVRFSDMKFDMSSDGIGFSKDLDVLINWKITIDRKRDFRTMASLGILNTEMPILNDFMSVFKATSKSLATASMIDSGIPVVQTEFSTTAQYPREFDGKKVYKPDMDNGGSGVSIVDTLSDVSDTGLVQPYIEVEQDRQYDYRVAVVGDRAPASYKRVASDDDFRTNSGAGGTSSNEDAPEKAKNLAIEATDAVSLDSAGVDVIKDNQTWKVVEVNAPFYVKGCVQVTNYDIHRDIVEHAINMVN